MENIQAHSRQEQLNLANKKREKEYSFGQQNQLPKITPIINHQIQEQQRDSNQLNSRSYEWTLSKQKKVNQNQNPVKIQNQETQESSEIKTKETQENIIKNVKQHARLTYSSSSFSSQEEEQKVIASKSQQKRKESFVNSRKSSLIKNQNQQEFVELNFEKPNVYQGKLLLKGQIGDYKQQVGNLCQSQFFTFSSMKMYIDQISQLKIFAQAAKGKHFKIKIVASKLIYNLGVELKKELYYLPQHYIWFAKLINARIMRVGVTIQQKNGIKIMDENYVMGSTFAKGQILKCSKYRKKWEKRYIVINTQGLFSYRSPQQSYSFNIPSTGIQQLWTNFDQINRYLVIKIKQGGQKTQFAIPIIDFCLRQKDNWLFAFYRLLMEQKIPIRSQ